MSYNPSVERCAFAVLLLDRLPVIGYAGLHGHSPFSARWQSAGLLFYRCGLFPWNPKAGHSKRRTGRSFPPDIELLYT
jgi:hypothetical protein